jgi:hypothetical protein
LSSFDDSPISSEKQPARVVNYTSLISTYGEVDSSTPGSGLKSIEQVERDKTERSPVNSSAETIVGMIISSHHMDDNKV